MFTEGDMRWVLCVYRGDCDEVGVVWCCVFTEGTVTRWVLCVYRGDCNEVGVVWCCLFTEETVTRWVLRVYRGDREDQSSLSVQWISATKIKECLRERYVSGPGWCRKIVLCLSCPT